MLNVVTSLRFCSSTTPCCEMAPFPECDEGLIQFPEIFCDRLPTSTYPVPWLDAHRAGLEYNRTRRPRIRESKRGEPKQRCISHSSRKMIGPAFRCESITINQRMGDRFRGHVGVRNYATK